MKKSVIWEAEGVVKGKMYMGGYGAYPTPTIYGKTKAELISIINEKLQDGSLDRGFGFEKLVGCKMIVRKITIIEIDGEEYTNIKDVSIYRKNAKGLSLEW